MPFLSNPHLDLTTSRIETARCLLVPFSTDGRVDIRELQEEFCRVNKNLYVSLILPTYEQELEYVRASEEKIARGEEFENFILDKASNSLVGAGRLRLLESGEVNIGIWIREERQGEGIATEIYDALILWANENLAHDYLIHSLHPENTGSRKLAEKFGGFLQTEKTEREFDVYQISLR
jgi:RimJ/RimL family protein N-acetyltransferase